MQRACYHVVIFILFSSKWCPFRLPKFYLYGGIRRRVILFLVMWYQLGCGEVIFFLLSSIFSLSFPIKSYMIFKNQWSPLNCDFIDFDLLFYYFLFCFWFFLKFFFSISYLSILFNLISYSIWSLYSWWLYFCFLYYSWLLLFYVISSFPVLLHFFSWFIFIFILLISIFLSFS